MTKHKKKIYQGQGIVEYILITALMALATMAVMKVFRKDVSTAYQKAGEALIKGVEDSSAPADDHG